MISTIHPTAIISHKSTIGTGVSIGPYSIIHDGVSLGDNSKVGSNCELGINTKLTKKKSLIFSANSNIRSHSIFYLGSKFDENLETGHRVTVREGVDGGKNLRIGTLTDIQGDCRIGNYVRIHSNVHIGKHSMIDDFVWLFPYCVLTNDPHPPSDERQGVILKKYAVISTMSVILPGVIVGSGALLGAHSLLSKNIPENFLAAGNPAKVICNVSKVKLKSNQSHSAYPWRRHYYSGYPVDVVEEWKAEFNLS